MTPLNAVIREYIQKHGSMPMGAFMAQCLYHAEHGYYTRGVNFAGLQPHEKPRDFITAPEMTPLFGYVMANWVSREWKRLGKPNCFSLLEAGPGRGLLMRDMLVHLKAFYPACFDAARPVLVEVSPVLREVQQSVLKGFNQCIWQENLSEKNLVGPVVGVANELLDAFPAQPYKFEKNVYYQQVVRDSGLVWEAVDRAPLPPGWEPESGSEWEISDSRDLWLDDLKRVMARLNGSFCLLDYGFDVYPRLSRGTLQAVRGHTYMNILDFSGETDLTVQVPFGTVCVRLGKENCVMSDLSSFLLQNGILDLGIAHPAEQPALQRLLHPMQMGALFRVCEYRT